VGSATLDDEIRTLGQRLADAFPKPARHPLRALDARAMERASEDAELRAALLRFVDVAPACRSLDDLASHLSAYLAEVPDAPPPLAAAVRMRNSRTGRRALGIAAAAGVRHMASRFIVGETPRDARPVLDSLWRHGIATSVDLLGETTFSAQEADAYARRCADALDTLARGYTALPTRPLLEHDALGPVARANLSVKVSALTPLLRPEAPRLGIDDAATRLRGLMQHARRVGAHLHVDMESLDSREAVIELVLELLAESEFQAGPSVGIVLQAYLRDSPELAERVIAWARASERAQPLSVRLVKGAYWDHEVIEARQHGWPAPVFERKADCDRNFEALTRRLLEEHLLLRVAIGSHNLRSIAHAVACNRVLGGHDTDVEYQVLRGLGDDLAEALASLGLRVRAYCPVGDLVSGMAYLVRRLLEGSANDSFLNERAHGATLEQLLAAP
jgi:proline dehydrogenase